LRERPGGVPVKRSGELIENDDKCEPGPRRLRPIVEFSAGSALHYRRESLGNGRIRSAAKPPLELPDHRRMIAAQSLRKPELENIF
jgi:hypothetical protein